MVLKSQNEVEKIDTEGLCDQAWFSERGNPDQTRNDQKAITA